MKLKEYIRLFSQRDVLKSMVLFGLLVILFMPVLHGLFHDLWKNNNDSHGLLVPFISLFLIWRNRHNIRAEQIKPSYSGLVLFIVSLCMLVLGYEGRIDVLPRIAFVTAIIGLVLFNYGGKVFLQLAFPLVFLFFMIPVPVSIEDIVSFKLQLWVTQVSTVILRALSITVLREGNILQFANCSLEVAEACSGIRSLTAFVMLGCLFGYMMRGTFLRRLMMVIIAVPLAFFVNIVRVAGTGILANYFGPSVARGFLHEFSGIAVFLTGLLLFFLIYRFIEKKGDSTAQQESSHG